MLAAHKNQFPVQMLEASSFQLSGRVHAETIQVGEARHAAPATD